MSRLPEGLSKASWVAAGDEDEDHNGNDDDDDVYIRRLCLCVCVPNFAFPLFFFSFF